MATLALTCGGDTDDEDVGSLLPGAER